MTKKLLLLGAGHAQVQLLHRLLENPLHDVDVTLVTPYLRQIYSGMVPGWLAGHYALDDCVIALPELIKRAKVRHVQASVLSMNAAQQSVTLSNGELIRYDVASINTGAVLDMDRVDALIPGAKQHAIFVRPLENFVVQWQALQQTSKQSLQATKTPQNLCIIGGGAAGIEISMAMRHAIKQQATQITLIAGKNLAGNYSKSVQRRIRQALAQQQIQVIDAQANHIVADHIGLDNGQTVHNAQVILALGAQAPAWLQTSDLWLNQQGFIQVTPTQQSASHANVFAAGDVSNRMDEPHPKSGVYAVRAGPVLASNIIAMLRNEPLQNYQTQQRSLNLLACGEQYAIASWGSFHAEGRWVWRWKDRIDRAFIQKYSIASN